MKLRIVDGLNPEDLAMLQALYSRSAHSVDDHLDTVKRAGSGRFMERYYVGYGHKSIADCGSTTMFIEGVSLLAAKAIQDWPLYSGQETSTRYIDMSKQPIIDPINTADSREIIAQWMSFYETRQKRVDDALRRRYPRRADEDEKAYERAITARRFDILRGFLPAGIATQLSWHTNLRQAGDHLAWLIHHPAGEVRELAHFARRQLGDRYPSSGSGMSLPLVAGVHNDEKTHERLKWMASIAEEQAYPSRADDSVNFLVTTHPMIASINIHIPDAFRPLIESRPRGCVLPHYMTDLGQAAFTFALDFGSFRDLQRHRNGVVRMPLLNTALGFDDWYLDQLDPGLREQAISLIYTQYDRLQKISASPIDKQYLIALGYRVMCVVTMSLPALLYFFELRSGKTVHPTLRARVHEMIKHFRERYTSIPLHVDLDPDDWTVRRGEQTIKERA